jgi:hypothetical protein
MKMEENMKNSFLGGSGSTSPFNVGHFGSRLGYNSTHHRYMAAAAAAAAAVAAGGLAQQQQHGYPGFHPGFQGILLRLNGWL